jgi:uncharacterized membrane protein
MLSMSKGRIETFSDGVFAIILTLLVLELHTPSIPDHSSMGQYATLMSPLIPKFVSFVLTFIMVSIHWVGHHYFFQNLHKAPLGLVWLNNLFLLFLCLMPFPTAMLGDHPTAQLPIILYGVNQLLAGLTFFVFRNYAKKNKLFIDKESAKAMGPKHSVPAILLFTLSIFFAFVNVYISLIFFLIVPLLYFVPNMIKST